VGTTGIRTPTDVRIPQDHFGEDFFLVHVEVSDPQIRYERTKQRGEARDPRTYEEFLQQDKTEEEIFHISKAIQHADITINNDGSLEAFQKKIKESVVQEILSDEVVCG
jgi:dephospho-CoA kinase